MDLGKLRFFEAIYRKRGISSAAHPLGVTPSAVSQALSALEDELDVRLFQRLPRGLTPTPAADSLYRIVTDFAQQLENCTQDWEAKAQEPSGLLRIGAPPEFGARQVIVAIARFNQYSRARFTLEFGLPDILLARLADGQLDLAFCDSAATFKTYHTILTWRPVFEEYASLVCTPAFHRKYVSCKITYSHLTSLPHVEYREDGRVVALWYRHHFGKTPGSLPIKLTANSVTAQVTAAMHGVGLAFIPNHLIARELKSGRLVPIQTGKTEYVNPIVLAQLKDKVPSLLQKRFIAQFGPKKSTKLHS